MRKKFIDLSLWSCGVALLLSPLAARADFLIEFHDGHSVTVGHYFEEKSVLRVYTPQGSIGFPKSEVKRILAVDEHGSGIPLETVSVKHPAVSSSSTLTEGQESKEETREKAEAKKSQAKKAGKEGDAEEKMKMTEEEAAEKYQDIQQQHAGLWEKHMRDVNEDAPEEVLEENRRQLNALDGQRSELLKATREESSGELPEWAQ